MLAITTTEVVDAIKATPAVLKTAADYSAKVANIAPGAVRAIDRLSPLLPLGPSLAPLVRQFNADAATILANAPQYAATLKKARDVLAKAPAMAADIASATSAVAGAATRLGNDPDLAPFVARLIAILDLVGGNSDSGGGGGGGGGGAQAPQGQAPQGAGLKKALPWLDRTIAVLRHPWLLALPVVGVIGVSAGVGYAVGRRRRG